MKAVLIVCMLLSACAPALLRVGLRGPVVANIPVRPNPEDVGVEYDGTEENTVYHGHTADQREQDAMEQARLGLWYPQAVLFLRTVAGCQGAADSIDANVQRTMATFISVYVGHALKGAGGEWFLSQPYGHFYDVEAKAEHDAQACLLSQPVACASAKPSVGLQAALYVHVENGRCLYGNAVTRAPLTVTWPVLSADPIRSSGMPPLDANQGNLLNDAETAHAAVMWLRCHPGAPCSLDTDCGAGNSHLACVFNTCALKPGTVVEQHLAFEASALAGQAHCFQIPAFTGLSDPRWTPAELCALATLEHVHWRSWADGLRAGQCGAAYTGGYLHLAAHLCQNIGTGKNVRVRFPCGATTDIENCPVTTCAQALAPYRPAVWPLP